MIAEKITLLIIDPQRDFHPGGSLAIPTADQDSERVRNMILEHAEKIDEIIITLDSHHRYHIAHARFWVNGYGESPSPFTIILNQDIYLLKGHDPVVDEVKSRENGYITLKEDEITRSFWRPRVLSSAPKEFSRILKWTKQYTAELERRGKFKLCIWPEHCIVSASDYVMRFF